MDLFIDKKIWKSLKLFCEAFDKHYAYVYCGFSVVCVKFSVVGCFRKSQTFRSPYARALHPNFHSPTHFDLGSYSLVKPAQASPTQ